jgi:hypothetical protein
VSMNLDTLLTILMSNCSTWADGKVDNDSVSLRGYPLSHSPYDD